MINNHSITWVLKPFEIYLSDPNVFEIRINKFNEIVCDTTKGRVVKEDKNFHARFLIHEFLPALANFNEVNVAAINNLKLPDGSRVIICIPPAVAENTFALSIRKHLPVTKSLEELMYEGRFKTTTNKSLNNELTLSEHEKMLFSLYEKKDYVSFLRQAVKKKQNIAISGSTNSGKTTFTKSLALEIPKEERIILLEDVNEISNMPHIEIVYLLYGEGKNRVSSSECLKACMRLSPDRILLTELRDNAAWDFLAGANTAHPGSIFSVHADDAQTTPARIADLVKQSEIGKGLDYTTILHKVKTTLDVVVFMANRNIVEIMYDPLAKKKLLSAL